MKKVCRVLLCAAAALTLTAAVWALEPALDPLPDLSAYPTQLLVNGQTVEKGSKPPVSGRDRTAASAQYSRAGGI